jgi:hypothetical protein
MKFILILVLENLQWLVRQDLRHRLQRCKVLASSFSRFLEEIALRIKSIHSAEFVVNICDLVALNLLSVTARELTGSTNGPPHESSMFQTHWSSLQHICNNRSNRCSIASLGETNKPYRFKSKELLYFAGIGRYLCLVYISFSLVVIAP